MQVDPVPYLTVFQAIAAKLTSDEALQEDCVQQAMLALLGLDISNIAERARDSYVRQAGKFSMLSYLDSYLTGNWYVGRKLKDGSRRQSRFVGVDGYLDAHLLQIDSAGRLLPGELGDRDGYTYMHHLPEGGLSVVLSL